MNANDVQSYLAEAKTRAYETEGLSRQDFEKELGVGPSCAKNFIVKEIEAGRLRFNGKRMFRGSDGRVSYRPVYVVVTNENR